MSMFCYQCQETIKNTGCTKAGVCGKKEETANLQDLLVYVLKGIAIYAQAAREKGIKDNSAGLFTAQALFATITNANFDNSRIISLIKEGLVVRGRLKEKSGISSDEGLHDSAIWFSDDVSEFEEKAKQVGVLSTENEDVRSLRELLIYGLKGIAAYTDHAAMLGFQKEEIYDFVMEALASTTKDFSVDEMVALVLKAGELAVTAMALLDEANTKTYGNPPSRDDGGETGVVRYPSRSRSPTRFRWPSARPVAILRRKSVGDSGSLRRTRGRSMRTASR